ncbi:hypothetical protein Q7M_6 [Borrelia crocidurae str. Achema]|uniref:Variable large protein n=1 Tax=Borrelia crocidurae (strain Achema) TaxID=1155096 RepID=I0FBC9_BORCA|nr:hypothetical protein Q7M_6 [Borrelia crocidurae str. Achema]
MKIYLESLKDIGDDKKVFDVTSNQAGVAANENALKLSYKALKGIVEGCSDTKQVKGPKKSDLALSDASIGITSSKNGR